MEPKATEEIPCAVGQAGAASRIPRGGGWLAPLREAPRASQLSRERAWEQTLRKRRKERKCLLIGLVKLGKFHKSSQQSFTGGLKSRLPREELPGRSNIILTLILSLNLLHCCLPAGHISSCWTNSGIQHKAIKLEIVQ